MRTPRTPAAPAAIAEPPEGYLARIETHLARLACGHDPLGHLFAIERLARAERSDRLDTLRHLGPGSPRR